MHDVYSYLVAHDSSDIGIRQAYNTWFCDVFPQQEFTGTERLFREFLGFNAKLDVPVKEQYVDSWAATDLRPILLRNNIKVPGTEMLDYSDPASLESGVRVCKDTLHSLFREMRLVDTNVEDFKVCASEFMTTKLESRLTEVLGQTFEQLQRTDSATEAAAFARDSITYLEYIYDKDQLEYISHSEENSDKDNIRFVTDTGIPVIDKDMDGLYETHLFSVEAQPGAGKTRFVLGTFVYRALTLYKENVLFFAIEQKVVEIEAILIARHLFSLYGIQVSADLIWKKKVPEELEDKVKAARIDLFESGKYGKIIIIHERLYLDTFLQRTRMIDKLQGPFKLICWDYMGLFEQTKILLTNNTRYVPRLEQYQIISRALRDIKNYLGDTMKCGIAISQFNEKGIYAGIHDEVITTSHSQGGIDVYRHTDGNIAISYTPELKAKMKRKIHEPKARNSFGFEPTIIDCRLGIALWYQLTDRKV